MVRSFEITKIGSIGQPGFPVETPFAASDEQRSNGEKYSSEYLIKMWVDPFVGGIYLTILVVRSQSIVVVVVVIGNSSTIRKKGNFDN